MKLVVYRWRIARSLLLSLAAMLALGAGAYAQVVVPPIAPPKPAVARNANALVISTGDLNTALNWVRQSRLEDATTAFNLFKDDWASEGPDIRVQSDEIADAVDKAIAQVQAVLDSDPTPSGYFPAFQSLADAVEEANTQLAQMAPPTAAVRIGSTDLNQAVNWASQGNLAKVHDEFNQFRDEWGLVKDAVREQSAALADTVETATNAVVALVANPANPNPAQPDYYAALQKLQQAVADANAQLATMASAPTAPAAPAAPAAPIQIRPGNLGESVDGAHDGDLRTARSEFGQFKNDWSRVKDEVRQRTASLADGVEAAIATAETALGAAAPVQADYVAALEDLQRTVADANAQLGN